MAYEVSRVLGAKRRKEVGRDSRRRRESAKAGRLRLCDRCSPCGESRVDNVRIAFIQPLAIQFEVLDDVSTVIVYEVWRTDLR
jgi:hypothetical protein